MMNIQLKNFADGGRLLGTRGMAFPIRDQIEAALTNDHIVELDFGGTNPTQSFVDELVGVLVLDYGASVLGRLIMINCNEDTKAILRFVVSDRLEQLESRNIESLH